MTQEPRLSLSDDLRTLLQEGNVTTQEDICSALEAQGHAINQSKVSRLLRKVGAVKSKNEDGQIVYRLPMEPAPPTLSSRLSGLVIGMVSNESMIIINTSPGSAQLLARILDYHKNTIHTLGSIAGDDTIFIAPKSTQKIDETLQAIKQLLYLDQL